MNEKNEQEKNVNAFEWSFTLNSLTGQNQKPLL